MRIDTSKFLPPFCPNTACPFHEESTTWRYKRAGFFHRQNAPTKVQRFRCLTCGRYFSFQTFQTSYWLKRPQLLNAAFHRLISCSCFRQIAREFECSHTTVMRMSERLGRHCLLFNRLYDPTPREPVVIDGFESFEFSQYYPCHFHNAVGAHSHWFYAFTDSELRRKGAMTELQRARREFLERAFGRPDPKSIEKEIGSLIDLLPGDQPIQILSDEHRAYPRAIRKVRRRIDHRVTSSKAARTKDNPLFPVNLLDLLIRHGGSNHKRETIAFSKRRQNAAERLSLFRVWRNFMKVFSENRGGGTPAQRLGLADRVLRVKDILKHRLFPSRIRLPPRLRIYYRRETVTRRIPNGRTHRLRFAD